MTTLLLLFKSLLEKISFVCKACQRLKAYEKIYLKFKEIELLVFKLEENKLVLFL